MTERGASRQKRRKLLLELIQREQIASQNQLQLRLSSFGVDVNQATLSRDLRELGIIKMPLGPTGSRYVVPGSETSAKRQYEDTFRRLVLAIHRSSNILLLRTGPGHAQAASLAMDNLKLDGVLGTVAGDDTFIAILEDGREWKQVHHSIMELVGLQSLSD